MFKPRIDEAGDTLIEIILAIIVIGLVAGALLASFATATTASNTHRNLVTADAALRNYAEATKAAARSVCNSSNYGAAFAVTYTPPSGFNLTAANQTCPASATQISQIDITATLPNGTTKALSIDVRTP